MTQAQLLVLRLGPNFQFYMLHELQKFELTLDQFSCEEAIKNF